MILYERTFEIHAAHLNNDAAYKNLWKEEPSLTDLWFCLRNLHGHNFTIKVTAFSDEALGDAHWLVDDTALAELVMEWNNKNLSVHEDFISQQLRATTEKMAYVLYSKLMQRFPKLLWNVEIWETDNIKAEVGNY